MHIRLLAALLAAIISASAPAGADDITGYLAQAKRGMPAVVDPPREGLPPFDYVSQSIAGYAKMDRETVIERDTICVDPRVVLWPGGNAECLGFYGAMRDALLAHTTVGIQKYFAVMHGDHDSEAVFRRQVSEAFFQLVEASKAINDRYARFRKKQEPPASSEAPPSN